MHGPRAQCKITIVRCVAMAFEHSLPGLIDRAASSCRTGSQVIGRIGAAIRARPAKAWFAPGDCPDAHLAAVDHRSLHMCADAGATELVVRLLLAAGLWKPLGSRHAFRTLLKQKVLSAT